MADSGSGGSNPPPAAGGTPAGLLAGRRPPTALSPGRLPSMRSRDLTLGGVKKKTFTPNIIGRKAKEEAKVEGGPRRERRDGERGRGPRERGRGRGRPEVIQSHSIFEQGPADMMLKKRGGYENERDAPSFPSPVINIKKEKRETEEETKEILRKLERDNFVDDPFLRSEQRSCPVQLPLAVSGWGFKEEFSSRAIKIEKVEEEEEPMDAAVEVKQEEEVEVKPEGNFRPPPLPQPELLPELLHSWSLSSEEELFFLQLPDSLPGQPPTQEHKPVKAEVPSEDGQSVLLKTENQEHKPVKAEVPSEDGQSVLLKTENQEHKPVKAEVPSEDGQSVLLKTENQEEEAEESGCHLKDLREGLIGKMLVRKSGRVQLLLGQVTLDVSLGTSCSFLQELVSIGTEGRTGDLSVLGKVKHKMVCSPDFEALLERNT